VNGELLFLAQYCYIDTEITYSKRRIVIFGVAGKEYLTEINIKTPILLQIMY